MSFFKGNFNKRSPKTPKRFDWNEDQNRLPTFTNLLELIFLAVVGSAAHATFWGLLDQIVSIGRKKGFVIIWTSHLEHLWVQPVQPPVANEIHWNFNEGLQGCKRRLRFSGYNRGIAQGRSKHDWVVVSYIFFIFNPKIGEDEPILTHIFQMGWFNHQLDDKSW